MQCHCGSEVEFSACCEPFLKGASVPETAEKLMRSRYTAFAVGNVEYIKNTLAPESRKDFDVKSTMDWSKKSSWKGLKILSVKQGQAGDKKGTVEFVATYEQSGEDIDHHEVSKFRKSDKGQWLFVDGDSHTHKGGEGHHHHHVKQETHVRTEPKIGRNDPCYCGSEKKFKKCHGAA